MTSFAEENAANRRLALLRCLKETEGSANESVLRGMLNALGFRGRLAAEDDVREDIDRLAKAGLVQQEWFAGKIVVATLTRRGSAYLRREVEPIEGIQYPDMGV